MTFHLEISDPGQLAGTNLCINWLVAGVGQITQRGGKMTFMAFSQLSGDMSSVSENLELARRLYGAEGASRVAGSIATVSYTHLRAHET